MRRQRGAAGRCTIDQLGDRRKLRLVGNGSCRNVGHPGDNDEHVVEVVKDAAGELADDGGSLEPIAPRLIVPGRKRLPIRFVKTSTSPPLNLSEPAPPPASAAGPCSDSVLSFPTGIR
jgi:hypothetical protein